MKRVAVVIIAVLLLIASAAPAVAAPPQFLVSLGYKFYSTRDLVFVEFVNPYFTPVNNVVINMTIKDARGKIIGIGQAKMDPNLIMRPGDVTSARVPIRGRVTSFIPTTAQFDFRIFGQQLAANDVSPQVVTQVIEVNDDQNGVPYVLGFANLDPLAPSDTQVTVQYAVLTFYDKNRRISWTELMPLSYPLTQGDSIMLFGKYEAAEPYDTTYIDVLFVTTPTQGRR